MKKLSLIGALLFIGWFTAQSQDYKAGIGLRAGLPSGLSGKFITGNQAAIEVILATRYSGGSGLITVLYEKHKPMTGVDRLYWFYGAGGHLGWYGRNYNCRYNFKHCDKFERASFMTLGIDGILGIEYAIKEIPFTIGLDVKPFIDLIDPGFAFFDGAFTIRYVFGK
jgi:hypothetical protein